MKLTVIGLGHIGGSYALSLKQAGFVTQVIGFDANEAHSSEALEMGIIDEALPIDEAIAEAHLVLVAIPVKAACKLIPSLLDRLPAGAVLMDVGSTKQSLCDAVREHPARSRFVATHPIAGTENSGPAAAMTDLLAGKKSIICEEQLSAPDALALVRRLYAALGMDVLYMDAAEHDVHLAYISHLSHLTSFSLALSVLRAEKEEARIFQFAGSGFDSTARLAKSSPAMWAPIFTDNKQPLLDVLDRYMRILQEFREQIVQDDHSGLSKNMEEANAIRRILEGNFQKKTTIPS